jgi:hypothetical protein
MERQLMLFNSTEVVKITIDYLDRCCIQSASRNREIEIAGMQACTRLIVSADEAATSLRRVAVAL